MLLGFFPLPSPLSHWCAVAFSQSRKDSDIESSSLFQLDLFFFEVCTEMLNYRGASCCLERLQWPLGTADELSSLEPKFSRLLSCQLHSFASVLKNLPQQLGNDKDCSVILHHIIMRKNFQIICMIGEASLLNFLWISLLLHRNSNTSVMSYLNERWEKIM